MEYMSAAQFAEKFDIDRATVLRLIAAGRIPAEKLGSQWAIPAGTSRPVDLRVKSGKYIGWRKKPGAE